MPYAYATLEDAASLADHIVTKRTDVLKAKINRYPKRAFTCSDIHECDRYMIHSVLDWDKRELHDAGLQAIFDAGNKEEENVKNRIGYELGLEFVEAQSPFEIKNNLGEVIASGKIDGKILWHGKAVPVEIKSMNENSFNMINTLDDFKKKPLYRKYLRQMQLYLYGNSQEAGLFIISNFRTEKIILVTLDYGECEYILSRLERLWEMKKKHQYPDPEYKPELCDRCPFQSICLTDVDNKPADFINNEALEEMLERREQLIAAKKEYDDIDEQIKTTFKQIPHAFVGSSFEITGKEQVRKSYDTKAMPDDIKAPYAKETAFWITKIKKL
jgi:CRISPR/Cas system-associated exonuclease Cas4 (RecB family)